MDNKWQLIKLRPTSVIADLHVETIKSRTFSESWGGKTDPFFAPIVSFNSATRPEYSLLSWSLLKKLNRHHGFSIKLHTHNPPLSLHLNFPYSRIHGFLLKHPFLARRRRCPSSTSPSWILRRFWVCYPRQCWWRWRRCKLHCMLSDQVRSYTRANNTRTHLCQSVLHIIRWYLADFAETETVRRFVYTMQTVLNSFLAHSTFRFHVVETL